MYIYNNGDIITIRSDENKKLKLHESISDNITISTLDIDIIDRIEEISNEEALIFIDYLEKQKEERDREELYNILNS